MVRCVDEHEQGVAHLAKHAIGPRTSQQLRDGTIDAVRKSAHHSSAHFRTGQFLVVLLALGCILVESGEQFLNERDRIIAVDAIFWIIDVTVSLQQKSFTEHCLEDLEKNKIPTALHRLHLLFGRRQYYLCSNAAFEGVKLHLLLHFPLWIRRFGAPICWDTSTWESAHKTMVKWHYKRGSKRVSDIHTSVLKSVRIASAALPHVC